MRDNPGLFLGVLAQVISYQDKVIQLRGIYSAQLFPRLARGYFISRNLSILVDKLEKKAKELVFLFDKEKKR